MWSFKTQNCAVRSESEIVFSQNRILAPSVSKEPEDDRLCDKKDGGKEHADNEEYRGLLLS